MKILCVGQNYARHRQEMGAAPPEAPVWFWKPPTAIVRDGQSVLVPSGVGAVHHEVELAVRIGQGGRPDAMTAAIDVTARDLQAAAKKAGRPWDQAKGYDTFLPLGDWVAYEETPQLLRLSLDGQVRQEASTAGMTWGVRHLLEHAATWTTLLPGDILLTGTPEGVGPILPGQEMVAELVGKVRLRAPVAART